MATGIPRVQWNGDSVKSRASEQNPFLTYPGRRTKEEILSTPPVFTQTAWTTRKGRRSSDKAAIGNRLYYGDNLEIMSSLLSDTRVAGKVRLVYIDPPYATNSVFTSRESVNAYQDVLVGSKYLEFLRSRLVMLRELLAADGSIYVHLDDNMIFHVKILMDEVFGQRQFRNFIVRKKCSSKNFTRNSYPNVADYVLFYTKNPAYVWNKPRTNWEEQHAIKEYPYIEEATGRRFKKVPVHAPGTRNGETGKPWRGMIPPHGRHWKCSPSDLDALDKAGAIYWSATGNPRKKVYLDESGGLSVTDIWQDVRDAHNQMIRITGYPTEKNQQMLERIVSASSNPGDLVLDCFSGSGTTLAASELLGRRWIGIDNSLEAMRASVRRLLHGRRRLGDVGAPDHGARWKDSNAEISDSPQFDVMCQKDDAKELKLELSVAAKK